MLYEFFFMLGALPEAVDQFLLPIWEAFCHFPIIGTILEMLIS